MDDALFMKFRTLVYEQSGINLGPTKQALVSSRIQRRLRALGFDDPGEYLR